MYLLVTSPHPDDDIVGMADMMRSYDGRVGVWFMTDGNNLERRVEATKALNLLGVDDVFWECLPFYKKEDRRVDPDDVRTTLRVLEHVRPTDMAVCYDVDPKGTHIQCASILQQAIILLGEGSPHAPHNVILYQSVWASTTFYPCATDFQTEPCGDANLKRQALLCHRSQLTLTTHDGFGTSLLDRGNLESEKRWYVSPSVFRQVPMCLPNLRRRTKVLPDIFAYVMAQLVPLLQREEGARIIFPTGNTPLPLYARLREFLEKLAPAQIAKSTVLQLDEYEGSTEYQDYLKRELSPHFQFQCLDTANPSTFAEHDLACRSCDLCLLGIGQNGHIGFNEHFPRGPFQASPTRRGDLGETTVHAHETPHRHAVTLGFGAILSAKHIVLMAGKNKQKIMERLWEGEQVAASTLAWHPNATLLLES